MTSDSNTQQLYERMRRLGIREEDLEEVFIRGSGPGGQKINKTSSTVVLRYLPTGVEIRCQKERQQSANRHWARVELCDRLEAARQAARQEKKDAAEKTRRQNRPRPRGLKEKILRTKKNRSEVKKNRGRARDD
jgi:peptide chain release factor